MTVAHRPLDPGMGEGVAARTILRTDAAGRRETWGDVARRVAEGSAGLHASGDRDRADLERHIANGTILMSGRHLQHGDATQAGRPIELLSNCSSSASGFLQFYLLMNGSGVGRSYDDALMIVDWAHAPPVVPVLAPEHPDWMEGMPSRAEALTRLPGAFVFEVPDSREGWAKAFELYETRTFARNPQPLILDFSAVRPKGSPIAGMQGRPSSGPVPTMTSFTEAAGVAYTARVLGMPVWEQTMRIDHAFAQTVAMGGARRAARIAVKNWEDPGIFDFIAIKQNGGLWSSNNSVGVTEAFWADAQTPGTRANQVFEAVTKAQYEHGSGEPGFVNLDRLQTDLEGVEAYRAGGFIGSSRYALSNEAETLYRHLTDRVLAMEYPMIVNPCGEISLLVLGAYCVIADVAPYHAASLDEVHDAVRHTTRALMRTNLMEGLYHGELARTNRIGVSLTGIFEWAFEHFGLTWADLLGEASTAFWATLTAMRVTAEAEADRYAAELGVAKPHTVTTIKPAGTTSKLFGLTEGAHLPAMAYYLRWVQFQEGDPLVDEYETKGYPVLREVPAGASGSGYTGVHLVGFPTAPMLGRIQPNPTTATEATVAEQFEWLRRLEAAWLGPRGNQVSYTLKYSRDGHDLASYTAAILAHQPTVRCAAVMPASDWRETKRLYGYVPEEPVSREAFVQMLDAVVDAEHHVTLEEMQCAGGACPL